MKYAQQPSHKHITDFEDVDLHHLDVFENSLKSPALRGTHMKRVREKYYTNHKLYEMKLSDSPMCICGCVEMNEHMIKKCTLDHMVIERKMFADSVNDIVDEEFTGSELGEAWACFFRELLHIDELGVVREWKRYKTRTEAPEWYNLWRRLPGVSMKMRRMTFHQVKLGSNKIWKGLWGRHIGKLENLISNQGFPGEKIS